jgi:hypothetical protein
VARADCAAGEVGAVLILQASAASVNIQTPIQSFFIPVPRFLLVDLQVVWLPSEADELKVNTLAVGK